MGGDVVVPPGRSSIVSAPQTGTLVAAEGGRRPDRPAWRSRRGRRSSPSCRSSRPTGRSSTPSSGSTSRPPRPTADGQLKAARPQFEQAKINLERTEKLAADRRRPRLGQLVDARNAYDSAKADARRRREAAGRSSRRRWATGAEDAGKLAPLPLRAPADGVLINVAVQVGQQVPAGSVLFEVANLDPVYVKVPVFVGEEESIAADKDAAVGGLADAPGKPTRPAKPVRTTPSANALATTVDLYYEVENHDGKLRPGQRVGVTLPLKGEAESLVVPYASILYDHNGGAWVYESLGKHVFARRRVVVDHVVGPEAVLALGPKAGHQGRHRRRRRAVRHGVRRGEVTGASSGRARGDSDLRSGRGQAPRGLGASPHVPDLESGRRRSTMFGFCKKERRRQLPDSPFPPEWVGDPGAGTSRSTARLPEDWTGPSSRGLIQVFLAEKVFEGCGGLEITDEIRVTIAAQACLLLLRRETDVYPEADHDPGLSHAPTSRTCPSTRRTGS